ncbi:MAG: PrsW family glutamic-type intramembrane protease [Polyangiaceae bacterium]
MTPALRWILPGVTPALLLLALVWRSDKRREPVTWVLGTFLSAIVTAAGCFWIEGKAAAWTGLDVETKVAGQAGALLFVFGLVAPVREAAKVTAAWLAFRSNHFDEAYDGIVYASAAAFGFAVAENVVMLRAHPEGAIWVWRALLALPAHWFFACLWGYALGRSRTTKQPGAIFPGTWLLATCGHALYIHFVYGRGPGALLGVVPMLVAMGVVVFFAGRDLNRRGDRPSRLSIEAIPSSSTLEGSGPMSAVPSSRVLREAFRKSNRAITLPWVFFGALITTGAMVLGLAAAIAFGHYAHVDFAIVDERDVATTAPVALLGSGLMAAFPVSGYVMTRASGKTGLIEAAMATALAIGLSLFVLGMAAPVALVFALASSPVAFGLSCAGAWIARPSR